MLLDIELAPLCPQQPGRRPTALPLPIGLLVFSTIPVRPVPQLQQVAGFLLDQLFGQPVRQDLPLLDTLVAGNHQVLDLQRDSRLLFPIESSCLPSSWCNKF